MSLFVKTVFTDSEQLCRLSIRQLFYDKTIITMYSKWFMADFKECISHPWTTLGLYEVWLLNNETVCTIPGKLV
jgi:hypothetical protein